ncbi:MAG TPA: sigma-70 family RNA polymerase sigma factor [Candidatus Baltobacteraceae bacterium]|nr:sigma-70 family RNA polymerase sigma factor [Candidatus Baltobacteraceae bacterium]
MTRWASPDLVAAAIAGEASAAERLVGAIWPACFRLAASLIGDRALAQDAAQEACVIIHLRVRTVRSAEAFDAWAYRIVARESSRVRQRFHTPEAAAYENGFTADSTASMDVWRALADLSPGLRDVTVLFYFDDLKTEEIADVLCIPHATVRTRLARARERLRSTLGDYAIEPHAAPKEVKQHAC